MSTIGSASHIEKLDEINRLRTVNAALVEALGSLYEIDMDAFTGGNAKGFTARNRADRLQAACKALALAKGEKT